MATEDQKPAGTPSSAALRVKVKSAGIKGKLSAFRPGSVRKRWWVIFGVLTVGGVIFSTLTDSGQTKLAPPAKKAHFISVTPDSSGSSTWIATSQSQVSALKTQVGNLQQQLNGLKNAMQDQTKALQSATDSIQNLHNLPRHGAESGLKTPEANNDNALPLPPPPPPVPVSSLPSLPGSTGAEAPAPVSHIMEYSPVSSTNGNPTIASRDRYKKNKYAGFLPVGSFMKVALLNGVDAGTSSETQSNPQPILVRVQSNAILPGSARYLLKSCFVLMSAYGNLSSQRVYGRAAELSCVNTADQLVINQPIKGYLVDSDGVLGLRGKVINRQGALLAKGLLAGFAAGLGQALTNAQSSMSMSALGSVQTVSGSKVMTQGAYSGAGNAANMLAQFYLKQAQSIFPVVAIRAGRKATLVITSGVSLLWHNYGSLYHKEVKPQK